MRLSLVVTTFLSVQLLIACGTSAEEKAIATAVAETIVAPTVVAGVAATVAAKKTAAPTPVGNQHKIMRTRNHIPEGTAVEYSTTPPTSGDHRVRWSQCGFFEHQLADERIVHNLEHGNIVVSYNLATQEEVDELRRVFEDIGPSTLWGVARAYDKIPPGTVAVSTWGVLDTMEGIDAERLEAFFDAYAGSLGPERVDCSQGGAMDLPPATLRYRPVL